MNQLGTVYATKRRRRNGKSLKPTPKDGVTKSNPSKRHRERLNAELDTLASLLPFEQNILSKLDRLSILRLSVSYLRTKSYFQVVMHKDKEDINTPPGGSLSHHHSHSHHHHHARSRDLTAFDHTPLDGEMFLQALNGFLMILTCDGEVFFATHSIEGYLGFHQSDIVHQSVYELVHSEDREELQRQLMWNSFLPPESANMGLQDVLLPDNCHLLERSFTVRFRCLLDNTSGFLRLDIRGRVKVLHGQNRKSEEPPLALFAICTPFGPPSLLEIPQKEVMFKSKHKLDLALVSMDQRGKMLLGYSDSELASMGGYDLVHYDDLAYVASAHQELLKTGASGMIAYRFQTKDGQWQWLQTSSRLVYKNSKPDFVISTHRPLMEEEGRDLLGKRTMDFKVSYLDAGLPNSYFSDSDQLISTPSNPPTNSLPNSSTTSSTTPTRVNRRYKTQLRDFLSTCRTKRKMNHANSAAAVGTTGTVTPPVVNPVNNTVATVVSPSIPTVDYISDTYNTMYSSYPPPATGTTEHSLSWGHSNFHNSLYPHNALDNRYLTNLSTENLFHHHHHHHQYHRPYYPEYQSYNGFLDRPAYDQNNQYDKLYCQEANKYAPYTENRNYTTAKCLDVTASWPYSVSPSSGIIQPVQVMELKDCPKIKSIDLNLSLAPIPPPPPPPPPISISAAAAATTSAPPPTATPSPSHVIQPKMEEIKEAYEIMPRQTVLMWGANQINTSAGTVAPSTMNNLNSPTMHSVHTMHAAAAGDTSCDMKVYGGDLCGPYSNGEGGKEGNGQVGGGGNNNNNNNNNNTSMSATNGNGNESDGSPPTQQQQQQQQHHNHHNNSRVVMVL